ncbi:MAG: hypothetical protein BGO05_22765 [Rhizobiales bacterium 63-7]|nr:MAG: hypothetical protein BGO05_22765 [Rhizobiales bacterium 63-7]
MPAEPAASEFDAVREELRRLAREEQWPAVAAILGRLPKLASDNREGAMAAQDLGVFRRSQGRRDEAWAAFDQALASARVVEPLDADLLAGALTDVGDVALEARRPEVAVGVYEELVALRRTQAAEAPVATARRLLSLALERLADAREARGFRSKALTLYEESLVIAQALAAEDFEAHGRDLALTRERAEELRARLA